MLYYNNMIWSSSFSPQINGFEYDLKTKKIIEYPIINESEIADGEAMAYQSISLEMPTFETVSTSLNQVNTAEIAIRNFPNPFRETTTIEYTLPETGDVTLIIRNAVGSEIMTLVNETQSEGMHQATINGNGLAAGTYFYTILVQEAGRSYSVTKRMMVF